jgi:hypothetical protein
MTWTGELTISSKNSYRRTVFKVNPVATTIMSDADDFSKAKVSRKKPDFTPPFKSTSSTAVVNRSPAPGPSGLQVIPISDSKGSPTDFEDDGTPCCVCNKHRPDHFNLGYKNSV